ncbi:MAG TPA: DUF6797 domain-containing protein [Parapedobacter sp.]|uniref:DUF6797 domain-containing protein n=1 Tax=Parapedobacter sp. TaxID=1958893 RepID=UPI002B6FFA15|nr:DUF6797 domain-containing protein [Parapedobacter sp.]HWK59670.1 DUF6797 domain-containing protein [Parapedobacter sp.]
MKGTDFWWVFMLGVVSCSLGTPPITENDFDNIELNPFIEPDFPFVSTYLDARGLGDHFPKNNVVSRGLMVNLGDSAYMCFDRDLLRWSVAWTGDYLNGGMLPHVSYDDFFNKKAYIPKIAGQPAFASGLYPGWSADSLTLSDVRPKEQLNTGAYWGALPAEYGRWSGVYVYGDKAVLSYRVGQTNIFELPGVVREGAQAVFTRALEIDSSTDTLFMNAAEVRGGEGGSADSRIGYIYFGEQRDSVVAVGVASETAALIRLVDNRYLSVAVPPSTNGSRLTVYLWRGAAEDLPSFERVVNSITVDFPDFRRDFQTRWPDEVLTRGQIAPDTAAFVADILTLPIPNPWKRNVRVIDLAFLDEETIVVSTFEGDVWIAKGVKGQLKKMSWKRFASGLYEPMSIAVHDGQIYVFGKEGIVRLNDLNGDGEADYYENFCDLMQQPPVAYAWAADMVFSDVNEAIFIANGGAVAAAGLTKPIAEGFRAGTNHSGSILKISLDGKRAEVYATGLRAPFLGEHPATGDITVTDQQGNYVAATPIYMVERGDFFGVPATAQRNDDPEHKRPLTWIPHRVDRSAATEVWMTSGKMGPLNDALVHFSFGKPGLFRVLLDSTAQGLQGGVAPLPLKLSTPILKGVLGPVDGQLYVAGFNLLGSSSEGVSAIQRFRYTGKPSYMPNGLKIGKQGIIVSFDAPLDPAEVSNLENYRIKRWNYKQTQEYGSGHFKLDGTPGEEILPALASYLSADRKHLLLLIPDMKFTDQMEVMYRLKASDGKALDDGIWFSVTHVPDLDSQLGGFGQVDLSKLDIDQAEIASLVKSEGPITRERGHQLFNTVGCVGCHSPGTETAGKYGPPFKGMYGTMREMNDGMRIEADDAYIRESILDPSKHVVKGYEAEMPSYVGVLSDADIEAIQLYIMYLKY